MIEFKLPSLGADMDQGTLLEWRVKPGDDVKKGDILAVVDTTKAALDVECWHSGKVLELLIEPGRTVAVGTPLALFLEPGEDPAAARAAAQAVSRVVPSMPAAAGLPGAATPTKPTAEPAVTTAMAAGAVPAAQGEKAPAARRAISPAARRRAAELGVALEAVAGSGPNGVVTLKDVEDAAALKSKPRDRGAEIRRTIAAAMSRSKREIPHYYLSDDVPLGAAAQWLRHTNLGRPITGRILMAGLFIRAVARAVRSHPDMNGYYLEGGYRPSAAVHLGMAISLRAGGLIAPAIHDADKKSLDEIMQALTDLVARARSAKLRRDELVDPTITLTNLGDNSVTSVTGVIYAPQVALVGFGEVGERPWVVSGQVVPMPVVTLTLAADHRVSDGHSGARFLAQIRNQLQNPDALQDADK